MSEHKTTRRGFLGWLGATAGSLAIYSVQADGHPAIPLDAAKRLPDRENLDSYKPQSSFVIRNEGQKPMIIAYTRTDGTTDQRVPRHGKFYGGRRTEAILLPGEELSIVAVEMKL